MKAKVLIISVLISLLSACNNDEPTPSPADTAKETGPAVISAEESQNVNPTATEITERILEEIEFPSPVSKTMSDVSVYYDINAEDLEDASFVVCGSGAYPDEIAVFKFNSDTKAADAKDALNKRLADQSTLYESYTPDEMYKLNNAFVSVKSNYAILCAVADNDKAKTIVDSFFDN